MRQMTPEGLQVVRIDYTKPGLPASVIDNHPVAYMQGSLFCCVLGPDPETGISGCGNTLEEAFTAFESAFQLRLKHPVEGDPVSEFIQHRHV